MYVEGLTSAALLIAKKSLRKSDECSKTSFRSHSEYNSLSSTNAIAWLTDSCQRLITCSGLTLPFDVSSAFANAVAGEQYSNTSFSVASAIRGMCWLSELTPFSSTHWPWSSAWISLSISSTELVVASITLLLIEFCFSKSFKGLRGVSPTATTMALGMVSPHTTNIDKLVLVKHFSLPSLSV